ncbi:microcin C transport system substrate-binding protein [Paracoccus isoporae]|uniref:Microcin C transport system substrate-binding protein n=1 Tax=Paracoccus isoporae TaxID=591205 RepID=A0A1G7BT11_9RHOB|nr:extracellular solute-binding protein [Paracoccus isoporae]SDE29506.1 microcin C transport system substrate-binding protein [Paracoccus isoporae]
MPRPARLAALALPLSLIGAVALAQAPASQPAAPEASAATDDAGAQPSTPAQDGASPGDAATGETTVAHGVSVFGEPALPPDFEHLPYVNPDAPKGGEISIALAGGFDSYNPYTVKGRGAALSTVMHESLMTGTMDEIGTAYCLLCETVEYPDSRDWAIFTLREEAAFSDGTPVTAEDVLFTYETLRDKGLSSFRAVIAQSIAGAEVLDDRRIRFDFVEGYPRRDVVQTAGGLPVFSKKDFEENGRELSDSSSTPFIGSGPYMFGSADMGRRTVWQRNPEYWGKDLPINIGRHNFDRIRIEYFGDGDAAFEGFKAGEYTFRAENSAIKWATGYDFPAVERGAVVKAEIETGSKAPAQGFFFNLRREKFQDPRVREAIGLMFNFEWSNRTLFYDQYSRTQSFWENSNLKAEGPPSEAELALLEPLAADLPDGALTEDAVVPPVSGERQIDRGNLRRAGALLDEAGWVPGSDGMRRNADGQVLSVEFMNDSQTFDRVINPFVENLRRLGVDAKMARVDNAEHENRRYSFDYDIIIGHALTDMIAGDGLYQMFGSQGVDDVFNLAGISNPAVDSLIGTAVAAETEAEMVTATHALDRVLRAMRPWVPNWFSAEQRLAYYDQYDYPDELPPYLDASISTPWYFDFAWFDAEKAAALRASGALR